MRAVSHLPDCPLDTRLQLLSMPKFTCPAQIVLVCTRRDLWCARECSHLDFQTGICYIRLFENGTEAILHIYLHARVVLDMIWSQVERSRRSIDSWSYFDNWVHSTCQETRAIGQYSYVAASATFRTPDPLSTLKHAVWYRIPLKKNSLILVGQAAGSVVRFIVNKADLQGSYVVFIFFPMYIPLYSANVTPLGARTWYAVSYNL